MNRENRKVVVEKYFYGESYRCPHCNKHLGYDSEKLDDFNYCPKCGQPLDWKVAKDTKAFVEI